MRKGKRTPVPLCRTDWLQDITIELGRRSLKTVRRRYEDLIFEAAEEPVDDVVYERFDVEGRIGVKARVIRISVWEHGISWIYISEVENGERKCFETRSSLKEMAPHEVAGLIRATLIDFHSVRDVWEQRRIS